MSNPFDHCDECPWPGKCEADEVCWLEVEFEEDSAKPCKCENCKCGEPELPDAA